MAFFVGSICDHRAYSHISAISSVFLWTYFHESYTDGPFDRGVFFFDFLVLYMHTYVCYDVSVRREDVDRLILRIALCAGSYYLFFLMWRKYISSFYVLTDTETYEGSRLALKVAFVLFISLLPLTDYRKIIAFVCENNWRSKLLQYTWIKNIVQILSHIHKWILTNSPFMIYIEQGVASILCGIYQIYQGLIQLLARLKGIVFGIVTAAVIFLMMEYYTDNQFYTIEPRRIFWNIVLYYIVYVFVWIFLRNIKWTAIVMIVLFTIFGMVNYFTILFRGNPVSFGDFTLIRTAITVAGEFDYDINNQFVIATSISIVFLFTSIYFKKPYDKNKKSIPFYLVTGGVMLTALVLISIWSIQTQFFYQIMYHEAWNTKLQANDNGYFLSFVGDSSKHVLESPENYDILTIENYMKTVESEYDSDTIDLGFDRNVFELKKEGDRLEQEPNIIVIMSESYADLSVLGGLETDVDYMPYFRSLTEDTIYGNLYVSPYGGNTVYSEFEFLTGNSMAMFPSGTIPYTQYMNTKIETPSLVSTLEHQDVEYETVAIHPYAKSGYHRVDVYGSYGFDRFITIEDFPEVKIWRKFMQDEDNYKKLIEVLEEKEQDQPMFIFNITMQNQGGYGERPDYEFQNPVHVTNYDSIDAVDEYLSGIKDSDVALEDLLTYFSETEEPVIVLFFGDHQPMLPELFYENIYDKPTDEIEFEDSLKKYIVPFFIWSNYENYGGQKVDAISTNYLSAILMELAGLQPTTYQKMLLELHEDYPVTNMIVDLDTEGNVIPLEELEKNEKYYMYEMMEYNSIIEKGNVRLGQYLYPSGNGG